MCTKYLWYITGVKAIQRALCVQMCEQTLCEMCTKHWWYITGVKAIHRVLNWQELDQTAKMASGIKVHWNHGYILKMIMIMYRKLTFLKYLTFLVIVNSYVMDTGMCLCMIKHRNMLPFFDKFTISSSAKKKCTEKLYLNFALSPEIAMNSHRLLTEKNNFA